MRRRRRHRRPSAWLLLAVAAGLLAGYLAIHGARHRSRPHGKLTMDEARAVNAEVPFVDGPITPADRYLFHGSTAARTQAIDCLATVAIYEAGQDADGQRAVMQVVLNRVRRPGYPKTVCGVVYQRNPTGKVCQFSFACDASLQRRPEHQGWDAARKVAKAALAGAVFADVGTATHYHTDWVVPYWSGSLDKVAMIGTHIFYRPK